MASSCAGGSTETEGPVSASSEGPVSSAPMTTAVPAEVAKTVAPVVQLRDAVVVDGSGVHFRATDSTTGNRLDYFEPIGGGEPVARAYPSSPEDLGLFYPTRS